MIRPSIVRLRSVIAAGRARFAAGVPTALAVVAVSVLLAACGKSEPGPTVLARVGDTLITVEDFNREVERRVRARQPLPEKEALVQEMVNFEAALQRAEASGLQDDPEVRREIEKLIIGKLRERELMPRLESVEVADDEVRQEYENHLADHTRPAAVRLAVLRLEKPKRMSDGKREELFSRMREARAKALEDPPARGRGPAATGFGSLAIRYSDEQASRYRGGDIGWFDPQIFSYPWPREVLETGYALAKDETSDVIETEQGLYVVMKTDSREARTAPFEQVEASLRLKLSKAKREAVQQAYQDELRRSAEVTIDQAALKSLALPTAVAQNGESGPPALPGGEPVTDN